MVTRKNVNIFVYSLYMLVVSGEMVNEEYEKG